MIENFLITWIPVFVILTIVVIGLLKFSSIRATYKVQEVKKGMTEEQVKPLLARLESEKDLLKLASKYGHLAKPLGSSVGKVLEKVLGGLG